MIVTLLPWQLELPLLSLRCSLITLYFSLITYLANIFFPIRYKYENNRVIDTSSPDVSSPLQYQLYGNGTMGVDASSKGTQNQLLERQVIFLFV